MKKIALIAVAALPALFSLPALAGPNWDVIHKAEADKAARKSETSVVLPLDHGPRAITTPWQNELWLSELMSQAHAQTKKPVEQAAGKRKGVAVATHVRADLPSHS